MTRESVSARLRQQWLHALFSVVVILFLALMPLATFSATVFEFSGVFDDCSGDCEGDALPDLSGVSFSGSFEIPIDTAGRNPDRQLTQVSGSVWYFYEFLDAEADFAFQSTEIAISDAPVTVIVSNCVEVFCALSHNFVWLQAKSEEVFYTLSFGRTDEYIINKPDVPTLDEFRTQRVVSFEVFPSVATVFHSAYSEFTDSGLPNLQVTIVPIAPPLVLMLIPLFITLKRR